MARIGRVCRGTEDMLLIRGKSVYVFQIEEALSELKDIDASYDIRIREEYKFDMVDVYIESDKINEGLLSDGGSGLKHRVADTIRPIIGMVPTVRIRSNTSDGLSATEGKKVTITDERSF